MRPIRSGALIYRVKIFLPTITFNDSAEPVESWEQYDERWANIEPILSDEKPLADGQDSQITHRVTLRLNSDVTHDNRIVSGSRIFEIKSILHDETNERTTVLCVQVGG